MDQTDKLLAISQTLPGLEDFLRDVLANESLSTEADEQRREFLKRLEIVSTPPTLPPRPATSSSKRPSLQNVFGSDQSKSEDESQSPYSNYRNDQIDDLVDFASQQRELSRNYTFSRSYASRRGLFGNADAFATPDPSPHLKQQSPIGSIKSSDSDDIYERLSLSEATSRPGDLHILDGVAADSGLPRMPHDLSPTTVTCIGPRGTVGRGSGGKGKLPTGWFKKEVKVFEEVYLSDLDDAIIQGYLKDMKSNKRRWCVIKDEKLYIFKTRDDPAVQIIDLPNCDIGIDDKKKISYSFRLSQTGSPLVHLAIEEGHDLSPWMSAVMAAAVRRGSTYRPTSPLENAFSVGPGHKGHFEFGFMKIDIRSDEEGDGTSTTYEVPIELLPEMVSLSGYVPTQSTPVHQDTSDQDRYDAPLPPLPSEPISTDSSSSYSSLDEDEDHRVKKLNEKESKDLIEGEDTTDSGMALHTPSFSLSPNGERIYDKVPDEVLNASDGQTLGPDNPSDQSSHWLSYGDNVASDEGGSSETKGERTNSLTRKRTSTVLSNASVDSLLSDAEIMPKPKPPRKTGLINGPRTKRRRKQTCAETESKFLQDPEATHSGVLFHKRPLGVWSKRYCKLIDNQLKCYRHPEDEKASLSVTLLGYDVSLIDSKESKRGYAFKISKPNAESFSFATDSRVSVERWIELLSLAATGRQDIMAPYPPYFRSGSGDELAEKKSHELLSLSESHLSMDSGDTHNELDDQDTSLSQASSPSKSVSSKDARMDEDPYDDVSGFAADELEDDASSDARELDSDAPRRRGRRPKSPKSPKYRSPRGRERVLKRRKETKTAKGSGTDSPTTMSPPHSVFVSDSGGESKPEGTDETFVSPEGRAPQYLSKKEKKGWADTLKLKQARFTRGHSLTGIVTGIPSHEAPKNRLNTVKKKNIQSYTHLLPLFDKEGRFSGFLTEVKASKYSTTQLRRWCVVKNGSLELYNKESNETPVMKLNLVEMWLTEESDETKQKYFFMLHGKEEKTFKFQVGTKENFGKWMSVLKVFTGIRVERASEATSMGEAASQTEQGSTQAKSTKTREETTSAHTFVKRPSIRMKISQRVNVMDIFKKSHSSYNFENPHTEDIIPTNELNCVNYSGGHLTEICVTEDNYTWRRIRWCTIKESELLIFTDSRGGDPVKRILLYNVNIDDASEPDSGVYKFKISRGSEVAMFLANDKADLERWLKLLRSSRDLYGKDSDDSAKCRIPSPSFPKSVFSHHRSRCETLLKSVSSSTTTWYSSSTSSPEKRLSYGSASLSTGSEESTDTLMNGHLQEAVEEMESERNRLDGSREGLQKVLGRRWCVVTSEKIFVYDSEDSEYPSREWKLADVRVKDESSDSSKDMYGFRLKHNNDELLLQNPSKDVIAQWLSVLSRYCAPLKEETPPLIRRQKIDLTKPRKSNSESNIKSRVPEHESKFKRTLSEGKMSGRTLLRRISEDNIIRKYRRPDLFKTAWKGSFEKLSVKMRDKSQLSSNRRDIERRFSCGSLFDSEGKYSGFLMEQVKKQFCLSQVRRWCVVRDDAFHVYEQPRMETARKVISIKDVKLTNESNLDEDLFVFRLDYGDEDSAVFRALSRTDLEKWITAISVKCAVLKSRVERHATKGGVIDEEVEPTPVIANRSSRTSLALLEACSHASSSTGDVSTTETTSLHRAGSILSEDSVFMEGLTANESTTGSLRSHPSELREEGKSVDPVPRERTPLESAEKESVPEVKENIDSKEAHETERSNRDDEPECTVASDALQEFPSITSLQMSIVQEIERISLQDFNVGESSDFDVVPSRRNEEPDTPDNTSLEDSGVINLGAFKVPWNYLIEANEPEDVPREKNNSEPIYANSPKRSPFGSDPIYENIPDLTKPTESTNTLSGLMINYGAFGGNFDERGNLHSTESIFVDMLPTRSSSYDFGPLYDNVNFSVDANTKKETTTCERSSKEYDEVFDLKPQSEPATNNSSEVPQEFEKFSLKDRTSFASDYSGIVGEALLDDVASVSSDRSRSGTSSSRESGVELGDVRTMEPAFDKKFLGDILGYTITAEEGSEISEFCSKYDASVELSDSPQVKDCDIVNKDSQITKLRTGMIECVEVLDDGSDSDVDGFQLGLSTNAVHEDSARFEDNGIAVLKNQSSQLYRDTTDPSEALKRDDRTLKRYSQESDSLRSPAHSSSSSIRDTYFGCSSSDDDDDFVDCTQDFGSEEGPFSKPTETNKNVLLENFQNQNVKAKLVTSPFGTNGKVFQQKEATGGLNSSRVARSSGGCSSGEEACDTYFGRSSESDFEKSTEGEQTLTAQEDNQSIILVGPVLSEQGSNAPTIPASGQTNDVITNKEPPSDWDVINIENETCITNNEHNGDSPSCRELTKSQLDIIRVVTEAFQGIMDISVEDHPHDEDTKL